MPQAIHSELCFFFFFHCQSRSVSPFDIYDIIFQQTCDVHAFQPLALSEVQNICFITTPLLILWHITLMNKQWKIVIGTNPLNKYAIWLSSRHTLPHQEDQKSS